jgi:hypothetical protein
MGYLELRVSQTLARRARSSDTAALRLGFLVGATDRGAAKSAGLADVLARRLTMAGQAALAGAPPARRQAYRRGLQAGRAHG